MSFIDKFKKNKLLLLVFIIITIIIIIVLFKVTSIYNCVFNDLFIYISSPILSFMITALMKVASKIHFSYAWEKKYKEVLKKKSENYVRISFAYLFRILINGKYLLVKSERAQSYFQPVGGVYKCNEEEKKYLEYVFYAISDDCIKIDNKSNCDYRMRVPIKKLIKFIKRFDKTHNRELINDLHREFEEELIKKSIISKINFNKIKYRYCGRHFQFLEPEQSAYHCYELLLADVVEFVPTDYQIEEFTILQSVNNKSLYYWANEEEIEKLGIKTGLDNQKPFIKNHSFKVLQKNNGKLIKNKYSGKDYSLIIK